MTRLQSALAVVLVLAAPSVASAGHVESDVLRTGDVKTWWKNNREAVLAGFRSESPKAGLDESLARNPNLRANYLWAAYGAVVSPPAEAKAATWANDSLWRAEIAAVVKRYELLTRDYQRRTGHYVGLGAAEFRAAVSEALSDKKSRERLVPFFERADVKDAIHAQLRAYDRSMDPRRNSEKAVVDLSMLLVLLDMKNKAFFMNGYSNDSINRGADYAGIYSNFTWTEGNIQATRDDIEKVLVEIGKPALPTMVEVWKDYREVAKDKDAMTLGLSSLAREFNWSTKDTRFPTPTHRAFKQDFVQVAAAVAPGTTPFEGLSSPAPKPVPPPKPEAPPVPVGTPRETQ